MAGFTNAYNPLRTIRAACGCPKAALHCDIRIDIALSRGKSMSAAELFAAGKLSQAVAAAIDEVKKQPADFAARWRLAEFLALQGDLERAAKHLETLLTQFPDKLVNIMLFRNLLRGEVARREVASEGRV